MVNIGQNERTTQIRVIKLFQNQLDYIYYENWQDRPGNSNMEEAYLCARGCAKTQNGQVDRLGLGLTKTRMIKQATMQQLLTGKTRLL